MKTAFSVPGSWLRLMACLCVTLWLTGCATQRVDWVARIGHYTYEQAVLDMGPPDKQAKLADGTIVAEWLTDSGSTYVSGAPGPYGPFYPGYVSTYTIPSRFVRLTFDPNGQLSAWKRGYK
jgi:hypothetical protein